MRVRLINAKVFTVILIALFFLTGRAVASSKIIYASDPSKGVLYKIDSLKHKVIDKVSIKGHPASLWMVNEKRIYIVDEEKAPLRIYNTINKTTYEVPSYDVSSLKSVFVLDNNSLLLGTTIPSPAIRKIDTSKHSVISTLNLPDGSKPEHIDIAANGNVYIADASKQKIYVINPQAMNLVTELDTNDRYIDFKISKNGKAYFTGADKNWDSGDWIDVWDTNNNSFVERITGLLPKGATFFDQTEGLSSQREIIIADDYNMLIALVFSPPGVTNNERPFPIMVGIDLSGKHIVWQLKPRNVNEEPISVTRTGNGDIYLCTNKNILVVNPTTGKIKTTIPLTNIWGITATK